MGQQDTFIQSPEYCRAKAEAALDAANSATDPRDKHGWIKIAGGWTLLAEEVERIAKVTADP